MGYSIKKIERKKINYGRILKFVKDNSYQNRGKRYRYYWHRAPFFTCPCKGCKYEKIFYHLWGIKGWEDFEKKDLDEEYLKEEKIEIGLRSHIYRTILFRADEEHIELLIRLYGKRFALEMLENLAKHSKIISTKIRKIIKKMKGGKK